MSHFSPHRSIAGRLALPAVLIAATALLAGCEANHAAPTVTGSPTDRISHMHRVPLQRTGQGSALVRAKYNGHEIVLLLDTGAQSTVIDYAISQQIGIPLAPGEIKTVGVGPGMINARQGKAITLDLNGFPAQVAPTVQDFSPMIYASRSRSATPTVGLLGYDVLVSYGAIIDLSEGAMYLRKP